MGVVHVFTGGSECFWQFCFALLMAVHSELLRTGAPEALVF